MTAAIDDLIALLKEAGAEVTLHGKPIDVDQLGDIALKSAVERFDTYGPDTTMCFVGGSKASFKCAECGSNCFQRHKVNRLRYRCNGCSETYTAEEGGRG